MKRYEPLRVSGGIHAVIVDPPIAARRHCHAIGSAGERWDLQPATAMLINGQPSGPLLHLKEGENVIIRDQPERPLVGGNVAGEMGPALPQLCALGQAICVLVAPETTYKANWQVYQKGRPVEVLCVENSTKTAAYVVSRPQPDRPPEFELEDGLRFCSPLVT